jgi:hypothetical protein
VRWNGVLWLLCRGRRIIPARPHSSLPIHVHGASCVGTARLSRFVIACGPWPRNPGRHRPHCQRANPIGAPALDPRFACTPLPEAACVMSDARGSNVFCPPSSFSIFLAYPLTTRDRRCKQQAAHDARGAPPPPRLRHRGASCGRSRIRSGRVSSSARSEDAHDADAHHARAGRVHIGTLSRPRPRPRGDAQVHLARASTSPHARVIPVFLSSPRTTSVRRASRSLRQGMNAFVRIRVRGGRGGLKRGWVRGRRDWGLR